MNDQKKIAKVSEGQDSGTPKQGDRNFLEAGLLNAEALARGLADNEAIAAIPIVSTAVKIARGIDDFRAKIFAAKLSSFVSDPSLRSTQAAGRIKQKFAQSPEEGVKIGETLLLVLDKFIDMDKPAILAKVFVAYIDSAISAEDLKRIAQGIDLAYGSDLHNLLTAEDIHKTSADDSSRIWLVTLANSGLTMFRVSGRPVGGAATYFEVTELGKKLWSACRHTPKATG